MSRQGAANPNNVGIALNPSGRVMHDEMAQRYQQQQRQQRQSMPPQQAPPSQSAYNPHAGPHRRLSYMIGGAVVPAPPPPQQPAYGAMTPYQPQPGYVAPPPPPVLQPAYTPAPAPYQPPLPQQQQVYQPQPHASAHNQTSDGKWILFYGAFFIYLDFYIL
jgi:hypothetical protein